MPPEIDAEAEIARLLARANLLLDACEEWLRDATDPTKYDLGPRSDEIVVTYRDRSAGGKPVRRKATLQRLLEPKELRDVVDRIENRQAIDMRALVLRTMQEVRHIVAMAAELSRERRE